MSPITLSYSSWQKSSFCTSSIPFSHNPIYILSAVPSHPYPTIISTILHGIPKLTNLFLHNIIRYMGIYIDSCAIMLMTHNLLYNFRLHVCLKTTATKSMSYGMWVHIFKENWLSILNQELSSDFEPYYIVH